MFEGCNNCYCSGNCGMDPMCEQCDFLLETEIEKARDEYYLAWLAYLGEYADS